MQEEGGREGGFRRERELGLRDRYRLGVGQLCRVSNIPAMLRRVK